MPSLRGEYLLPYLALGLTPIKTPGREGTIERNCMALALSYNSAIESLSISDTHAFSTDQMIDARKVKSWFNSLEFDAVVDRYIAAPPPGTGVDEDDLRDKTAMSSLQASLLLELVNDKNDTNLQLAFIKQGYWGKMHRTGFNPDTYVYDNDYPVYTRIEPPWMLDPGKPVIFIWSNNAEDKFRDPTHPGKPPSKTRWDAFRSDRFQTNERRDFVERWMVGTVLKGLVEKGVYVVVEWPETGGWFLKVSPGFFVHEVPSVWPPVDGFKFMATPDDISKGFLLNKCIQKMQGVSKNAPNEASDGDAEKLYYPFGPGGPKGTPLAKKVELLDHVGDDGMADNGMEAGDSGQPILKALRAAATEGGPGDFECRFYRVIEFTDKTGNYDVTYEEKDMTLIPDVPTSTPVKFAVGDWFLDDTGDRSDPSEPIKTARVTDINGIEGHVRLRRLQRVLNPWCLPDRLPLVEPELELREEVTTRKLNEEARRRGIDSMTKSRAAVLAEIKAFDKKDSVALALSRVTTRQAKGRYGSETAFDVGEIVMAIDEPQTTGPKLQHVRDYEGFEGQIPSKFLEELFRPFMISMTKNAVDNLVWMPAFRPLKVNWIGDKSWEESEAHAQDENMT